MFSAVCVRVCAWNVVEARVDIGFGVSIERTLRLDTVSTRTLTADDRRRGQHCLIVLVGSKRLLVDIADRESHQGVLSARVYLREPTFGRLVGHTYGLHRTVDPVLELAPFIDWLSSRNFDVADVRAALSGSTARKPTTES